MIWALLLAHLIADFPLQPDWMVRNKRTLWVLVLHVSIHFLVLLLIVGASRTLVWGYLLGLTVAHFWIDMAKNEVQRLKPGWIIMPYLVDQLFHLFTILGTGFLLSQNFQQASVLFSRTFLIYACGYLIATYVWFITERILTYANPKYRQEVMSQSWPRMAGRALYLSVLLLLSSLLPLGGSAATLPIPYLSGKNSIRALITDVSVAVMVMLLIRISI